MPVVRKEFEPVAAVFRQILAEPGELGGGFAAELDGEPIVDLWGGIADATTGRPWTADTPVVIFSGTKGITALCLLLLWDRGAIQDSTPVSQIWPEFAAGKESILVRHVLTHTAGIPGLRRRYSFDDFLRSDRFVRWVEKEPPLWPPGEVLAYHPRTFGTICGEIVRRVDGRSLGRFFREEFGEPLALDVWVGAPEEVESRIAVLDRAPRDPGPPRHDLTSAEQNLLAMIYYNPPDPPGGLNWNRPDAHRAESPSSGGIATARSMARLFSLLAGDGTRDGQQFLTSRAVRRARSPLRRGRRVFEQRYEVWGPGFHLGYELSPRAAPHVVGVGHCGYGGSVHGAWPDLGVSFSYTPNRLLDEDDDRGPRLLDALYASIEGASEHLASDRFASARDGGLTR